MIQRNGDRVSIVIICLTYKSYSLTVDGSQPGPSSGRVQRRTSGARDFAAVYTRLRELDENSRVMEDATALRIQEINRELERLDSNAETQKKYFIQVISRVEDKADTALERTTGLQDQINNVCKQTQSIHEHSSALTKGIGSLIEGFDQMRFNLPDIFDNMLKMRLGSTELVTGEQLHRPAPFFSSIPPLPPMPPLSSTNNNGNGMTGGGRPDSPEDRPPTSQSSSIQVSPSKFFSQYIRDPNDGLADLQNQLDNGDMDMHGNEGQAVERSPLLPGTDQDGKSDMEKKQGKEEEIECQDWMDVDGEGELQDEGSVGSDGGVVQRPTHLEGSPGPGRIGGDGQVECEGSAGADADVGVGPIPADRSPGLVSVEGGDEQMGSEGSAGADADVAVCPNPVEGSPGRVPVESGDERRPTDGIAGGDTAVLLGPVEVPGPVSVESGDAQGTVQVDEDDLGTGAIAGSREVNLEMPEPSRSLVADVIDRRQTDDTESTPDGPSAPIMTSLQEPSIGVIPPTPSRDVPSPSPRVTPPTPTRDIPSPSQALSNTQAAEAPSELLAGDSPQHAGRSSSSPAEQLLQVPSPPSAYQPAPSSSAAVDIARPGAMTRSRSGSRANYQPAAVRRSPTPLRKSKGGK